MNVRPNTEPNLYIVGVGTSAGGLEALERFFSHMPLDLRFAFIVVQHLSPDYKSHMVELLSKYTEIPVYEAGDGMEVQPGNIYLLPRRKNMTIFKGKLFLIDYDRNRGLNLPIDILFESLAQDQKENAIGVILSGTGSDGTRGIRAIKEMGGFVLAQDDTARFDGMPRSAIGTQLVDYIAAPENMPEILVRYVTMPRKQNGSGSSTLFNEENRVDKLLAILRNYNGVDFTGYKSNTLNRRIERRMNLNDINTLEDYITFLQKSPNERQTLFKEFLIGVTRFFRDPEAFEFLQSEVIPELMADKNRRDQIRIWVTGCSTGEEAYSIAMLFQEYMETTGQFADVKIFATDIDKTALDFAGRGMYPESVLADIPGRMLQTYFFKKSDHYEILRQVRSMVVFAYQNLITDPPFSRLDLISCRNLLIYLQPDIQQQVLETFQFSLKPGGFLFLGNSESLGDKSPEFSVEHSKWKIYRFTGSYPIADHRRLEMHQRPSSNRFRKSIPQRTPKSDWQSSDPILRNLVEQILPPCVVVDEQFNMIHAFGEVDPYLSVPKGYRIDLNLLKLVNQELTLPISTALHRTFNSDEEVIYRRLSLDDGGTLLDITTRPFWNSDKYQKLAIVVFAVAKNDETTVESGETFRLSDGINQRISHLERELQYTRENLQATIEELETSNEELQATNEELLAANEELQSTNEELQSVNEELMTVNSEYQAKIRELSALNDDMNNLFKSIDIGTIFLDGDLRLRKFTPAVTRAINLLEQDIGRPINHFAHNLADFDLLASIQRVLDDLIPLEQDVVTHDGQWYQLRILPYRTHNNQINGVVITIVDITELRRALSLAEETDTFAQTTLNSLSAHIAVLDREGVILDVNEAWQRFSIENGGDPDGTDVGVNYLQVCQIAHGPDAEGASETYENLKALLDGKITEFELEYPCHAPHEERWYIMRGVPLNTGDGRVVVSHINITERKLAENAQRRSRQRLQLLMQSMSLAIFEHDTELRYTWIDNHNLAYPPADHLNQTDTQLLGASDANNLTDLKRHVLQTGESLSTELQLNFDGQHLHYAITLDPIRNQYGEIQGLLGAYRDLNESASRFLSEPLRTDE